MKKLFFCACIASLAISCTNDELIPENSGTVSKGITFEATIEESDTDSRGSLTSDYRFFWHAEVDRINVYADNVAGTYGAITSWATPVTPAVYKATKSQANGQFTSKADDHTLSFVDNYNSYFVGLYPESTTLVEGKDVVTTGTGVSAYTSDVTLKINVAKSNLEQTVSYNEVDAPMVSGGFGNRNADYESVGEKMVLRFKRPFPALAFTSADNTSDLNDIIGGLKSITVQTKGAALDEDGYQMTPTQIGAVSATYDYKDQTLALTSGAPNVTVKLDETKAWGANDKVYMSIYPVKRLGTKALADPKRMTEKYTVTYTYNDFVVTKDLETSNDWIVENGVYELPTLNIAAEHDYILTNSGKLYIFRGEFSAIYNEAKTHVVGNDGTLTPASWINTIISEVALTDAELQELDTKFTALTKLTLKANTAIPANVFKTNLSSKLTDLNLPSVTTFNTTGNEKFGSNLLNLNMNSYTFAETEVHKLFFNDQTATSLQTIKIEAVQSLRPVFGADRTIYFTNFVALKSIALNPTCVAVPANGFKGCSSLETVTGKLDISNAPSAFEGAGSSVTLPTINVYNRIINNNAFAGANIKSILYNGSQVVPTEIGTSAFEGNDDIEIMDLSQATKIGEKAFYNATSFIGNKETGNVVTISANILNKYILSNTAVVRVQFTSPVTLNSFIFYGTSSLQQIKFLGTVAAYGETAPTPFSGITTTNIDLFLPTSQDDVDGLVWRGKTWESITKENTRFNL